MIFVTGDTHGSYRHIRRFVRERGLGAGDLIVCLGDTGFNYYGDQRDGAVKDKAAAMGVPLLCVRGNHDRNPATLPGYRLVPWHGGQVYCDDRWPTLLFARDGSVFDLDGLASVAIGGAYSVDKAYRLAKGYAWFPDEQLSPQEKRAVEEALAARGWRVDAVLSHTCPASSVPQEALHAAVDQSTVDTAMEDWLQVVEQRLAYRRWFCGHFHTEKQVGRLRFLYHDIVEL